MDEKIKLCYIISDVEKSIQFEGVLKILRHKYDLRVILLSTRNTDFAKFLAAYEIPFSCYQVVSKIDFFIIFLKVFFNLLSNRPNVVHCHLFKAGLIGCIASYFVFVDKRIYTRHHSDLHHKYFPKSVLFDKLINTCASQIIAPTEAVANFLEQFENVKRSKICVINHGFDFREIDSVNSEQILHVKEKYGIENQFVVGVISRYTHLKGIEFIIQAFKSYLEYDAKAVIVLANAKGDYEGVIKKALLQIPRANYVEISFEKDVYALYKCFDVFIHVPIAPNSEAFGQVYIESLASGIPSIFTKVGIAIEFVQHKVNSWVVPFQDSESILRSLIEISADFQSAKNIARNGRMLVHEKYSVESMILALENVYAN